MKYATWIGMAIVSLIMLMGGYMKLTGNPLALQSFADLGLPGWFPTFIGLCEIAGGIFIWVKRTSMYAAIGIALVMIGAIYYHFAFPPISAGAPAIIVLALSLWIAARRGTGVV